MARPPSSEDKGRSGEKPSAGDKKGVSRFIPDDIDPLGERLLREREMTWETLDDAVSIPLEELEEPIDRARSAHDSTHIENQHTQIIDTATGEAFQAKAPRPRRVHHIHDKWRIDLRAKKGNQPWTAEETYRVCIKNRVGTPADQVGTPATFALFDVVQKHRSWREKPLTEAEAVGAVIALLRLNRQAYQLLTATDVEVFPAQPPESPFWKTEGMLCFKPLSGDERIASLTAILSRISKLTTEGKIALSEDQRQAFAAALSNAVMASGHQPSIHVMNAAGGDAKPMERWREVELNETAAQYFERVIAPIPFVMRPSTTALAAEQPELFRALKNVCADQKRFNRVGLGELGRAHGISEVLPIGAPKPRKRPQLRPANE